MKKAENIKRDGGWTLIELMIVIIILGVLAIVTVYAVRNTKFSSDDNGLPANVVQLARAS